MLADDDTLVLEERLIEADPAFRDDVLAGLAARPRAIPARWFYDETGSRLFEDITRLAEYYPTRTESALLRRHAMDIATAAGRVETVVEFGSGSSAKTPHLLRALVPRTYVPIDISGDFLRASAAAIQHGFPGMTVIPLEGDFLQPLALPPQIGAPARRLGFFPGSTIGNMTPPVAIDLLRSMATLLGDGSKLLIGIDRIKDPAVLVPAYDDPRGVTAAFNLNLIHRINRELDADIPPGHFRHRAIWNDQMARVEMHLEAIADCHFTVAGQPFSIAARETIHTENSHKYSLRSARMMLHAGGWQPLGEWTDRDDYFLLILAEARPAPAAP